MLAWTGGSKRRLRRQLRNQPAVEGVTVPVAEHPKNPGLCQTSAGRTTVIGKRKQEIATQGKILWLGAEDVSGLYVRKLLTME